MKIQPAVKKETSYVFICTLAGTILLWLVNLSLHQCMPERVPFGFGEMLSSLLGMLLAILNFFWMGMTVQSVVQEENQERAVQKMRLSYRYRMIMQMVFAAFLFFMPGLNFVTGLLPLIFPSISIKLKGVFPTAIIGTEGGTDDKTGEDREEGL